MKTLIIILIIASFLQTTIIPVDLVLLVLISRAYIKSDKANFYLAFAFGLLVGHLNLSSMGFESLIYLIIISATVALSKLRLAGNPLMIVPLAFLLLSFSYVLNAYFGHQTLDFSKVIFASFLALPSFYIVRLWEERFIVQKEIKLKIK